MDTEAGESLLSRPAWSTDFQDSQGNRNPVWTSSVTTTTKDVYNWKVLSNLTLANYFVAHTCFRGTATRGELYL